MAKKMAEYSQWLSQKEAEIASCTSGRGKMAVQEAKRAGQRRADDITNLRNIATQNKSSNPDEQAALEKHLSFVQTLSENKMAALDNIAEIAALETEVCNLAGEFDRKAVHLVNLVNVSKSADFKQSESRAKSSQGDYVGTKRNWQWIQTVLRCAEIHRHNAADYHQFFYDVNNTLYWMKSALPAYELNFPKDENLSSTEHFFDEIITKLKALSSQHTRWRNEVYRLFQRSSLIVPVPSRVHTLEEPRPVLALADYKTDEIEFLEGDSLLLTDNTDKNRWKVTDVYGLTAHVQSVLMLIPALSEDAVEAAVKLQIDFNSLWSRTMKKTRYQLIQFILTLFRDWSNDEIDLFHHMKPKDKKTLLHNLKTIESILVEILGDSDLLHRLQENIFRLTTIIEESRDDVTTDSKYLKTIVMQFEKSLTIAMMLKMFWNQWLGFKESLERFRDPSVFTEETFYTFISSQRFKRFLEMNFSSKQILSPLALPSAGDYSPEEIISPGSHVVIMTEHTDIEKEELKTSSYEEYFRYLLKAAIDPRDNSEISIGTAKDRGILDSGLSCYTHLVTKETMSIFEAVQKDLLVGTLVAHRKDEEKKSFGIIVVKSFEETSQYSIQYVIDPITGEKLDEQEATRRRIIDSCGLMYTLKDGSSISVSSAIEKGLVIQENSDHAVHGNTKVVSTTYIVTGVVDQKQRNKVSIQEGLRLGILDRETNEYVDNVTGKRVGVQEAIKLGFIKGRLCKDPSKLEYDPENSLVIKKLRRAKTNLMRSLQVINAFRTAKH